MRSLAMAIATALFLNPLAQAETLEMTTGRRAFLHDLNTRVTAMYDLNNVHIRHIYECLQKMTDEEFSAAAPLDPKKLDPWKNCADGVAQVKNNTKIRYPLARHALLLSQLLTHKGLDALLTQLWRQVAQRKDAPVSVLGLSNQASLFANNIRIVNPLETWLSSEELPRAEWTQQEILDAIQPSPETNLKDNDLNSLMKRACTRTDLKTPGQVFYNFCNYITVRYSEKDNGIYLDYQGSADLSKLQYEIEHSRVLFAPELSKDQKKMEDQFKALVAGNPYVGLVTSSTPSRLEFLRAFAIMFNRSQMAIAKHTAFRAKYSLDDPEKADESAMLTLMDFKPITQRLADNPGPELKRVLKGMPFMSTDEVREDLEWSHTVQDMERMGYNILEAVVANALICWIPTTKVVGSIARPVLWLARLKRLSSIFRGGQMAQMVEDTFTPICYTVGGIAINMGMVFFDVWQYDDVYRDVFSSAEEETLMKEVKALSDKDREIFWSLVSLPMGTGALGVAKKLYPKVSAALRQKIEAQLQKFMAEQPALAH